jgi:hypothetical protein
MGPNQTVTTAHPRPHRWSQFQPSTRGQVRLSQPDSTTAASRARPEDLYAKPATNMSRNQWREWVSSDIPYEICRDLPIPPDERST